MMSRRSGTAALLASALALVCAAAAAGAQDAPPPAAFYVAPETSTAAAGIAVGPDGALHAVATSYIDDGPDAVTYSTCRTDCANPANWTRVDIPVPGAVRAEIAVTPWGAPRLLITTDGSGGDASRNYLFAECGTRPAGNWGGAGASAACLDPAGWRMGVVAGSEDSLLSTFLEYQMPHRSFALDDAGNPRFIYSDSNYFIEPDHYGAFYMSCESDCTLRANWIETDIALHAGYSTEYFNDPVLALGPGGSAHVISWVYAFNPDGSEAPDDLYYYECRSDCTDRANWGRASVLNPGSGSYPSPTWDIAVTSTGEPRIALFVGAGPDQADLEHSLVYLWCETNCLVDNSWSGNVVFSEGYGEAPALALDAQDRPRIAFLSPGAEPVYAACDETCDSDAAVWRGTVFEAGGDMAANRPVALPFTCDAELWNAMTPDLAVGPRGDAYLAYDVDVQARCLYREFQRPEITYEFHEIWRGVRLAFMPPS